MLRSPVDRCFLMTAPGTSALATVRIAGPGVVAFLERRFSKRVPPGRPVHGELRDDAGVIDDPVVVLREDGFAADVTLHGGSWIAHCVTELARRDGFLLSPVDVETIGSTDASTIFEHEWLVSLPKARTELAMRTLLAQPEAWKQSGATEEYPHPCERILADRSLEYLLSPPTIAIVGIPNAGKSTLANRLFGQTRSIVSPIAGTTRDWVGEEANLDGLIVKLIDTPGRRLTDDPIEHAAIGASIPAVESAEVKIVLLDGTLPAMTAEQQELLDATDAAQRTMLVINKADRLNTFWHASSWADRPGVIRLSAETGEGVDELVRRVHQLLGVDQDFARPRVWTARQREEVLTRAARF